MSRMKLCGVFSLLAASVLAPGCVPADAGYQDVRSSASARIHKDVRWGAHDSTNMSKETQALLSRPLNADSAVQIALLNNQSVQAAFEELGIARARLVDAVAIPNPSVDAALRFKRSTRPNIDLQATLSLSELLFLPWRNAAAGAQLDAAKASVAGRIVDLAFDVRVAFYEYQAAAQSFELRKTILKAASASFDSAQGLHDAGNITDLNLENERSLFEESRVASARAEAMLSAQREHLTALMGLWGGGGNWAAQARLADPAPLPAWLNDLEGRALSRSLDLQMLRQRVEAAAKRANLSRLRGWIPELRGGVSAERDQEGWGIGPAASLELPLFYQGQGETGVALAEMRRDRKMYGQTAVQIRAAARTAAVGLKAAADSADYYKRVLLPLRQRIVNDTQLEYNAMSVGVFQLLQAKRDQIETARAYVDLLRDYWKLRAEVDQLEAGRLPRIGLDSRQAGEGNGGPAAATGAAAH